LLIYCQIELKGKSAIRNPQSAIRGGVQPLLKWAGGKRQLLPALRRFYPARFHSYIEPFFGSGAVFFDLHSRGLLRDRDVVLIDSNADLIGCYETVRDSPEDVARELERLARAHALGGSPYYYRVRDDRFNPLRNARRRPDGRIAYTPELAAMLIYLNRTGFNGLFRLNARGAFNVPAGRYARPAIVNRSKLHAVADALALPRVKLLYGSFELARDVAGPGDFLYCDPPYAPLSRTANFTSYTTARFGDDDQVRLQQLVVTLAAIGCHVLVSNSTAAEIASLYDTNAEARAVGLRAMRVPARRAINSNAAKRGAVEEYLITNIALQDCRIAELQEGKVERTSRTVERPARRIDGTGKRSRRSS
jgi:DNA adenine methylase